MEALQNQIHETNKRTTPTEKKCHTKEMHASARQYLSQGTDIIKGSLAGFTQAFLSSIPQEIGQ